MQQLHLQELLVCSTVCRRWAAAVAAVAANGCAAELHSVAQNTGLGRWMQLACWMRQHSNTSKIKLSSLKVCVPRRLSWQRVSAVQHADMSAAREGVRIGSLSAQHHVLLLAAANPLATLACRQLTSLDLTYCSVNLSSLSQCTNLRSLKLHYPDLLGVPKYHTWEVLAAAAAPAAGASNNTNDTNSGSADSGGRALPSNLPLPAGVSAAGPLLEQHPRLTAILNTAPPSLHHLTCLEVTQVDDSADGIVVSSILTQLQRLSLSGNVDQGTLAQLPTSLTALSANCRRYSMSGRVAASPAAAHGLCKLSALCELELTGVRFELGILAGWRQLRKLVLRDIELTAGAQQQQQQHSQPAAGAGPLHQLQHLEVHFAKPAAAEGAWDPWDTAFAAAGMAAVGQTSLGPELTQALAATVTASSQLTYLSLGHIPGPDVAEDPTEPAATFISKAVPGEGGQSLPALVTFDAQPGLITCAANVSSISSCCPNLRALWIMGVTVKGLHRHLLAPCTSQHAVGALWGPCVRRPRLCCPCSWLSCRGSRRCVWRGST